MRFASCLSVLLLASAAPHAAANAIVAQANLRGFDAKSAYAAEDIDTINLQNGNLQVTIPLVDGVAVGPGLTLGFALHYNSRAWDFREELGTHHLSDVTDPPTLDTVVAAVPARDFNAGLGWKLSFGELYPPDPDALDNDPGNNYSGRVNEGGGGWLYVDGSGARHGFSPRLRGSLVSESLYDRMTHTPLYSGGGTYLRMTRVSAHRREVASLDGTVRIFTCSSTSDPTSECWRLAEVRDAFGNRAMFTPVGDDTEITLSSPGAIASTFKAVLDFEPDPTASLPQRLKALTVTAVGGVTVTYGFEYEAVEVARGCHPTMFAMVRKGGSGALLPNTLTVSMLKRIEFPDGGSYELDQAASPVADWREVNCSFESGRLLSATLPTGATIAWDYGLYTMPGEECTVKTEENISFPPRPSRVAKTFGIVRRSVTAASGTLLSRTGYVPGMEGESFERKKGVDGSVHTCFGGFRQLSTTVLRQVLAGDDVTPTNADATVHYFNAYLEDAEWRSAITCSASDSNCTADSKEDTSPGWMDYEFGLPFSRYRATTLNGKPAYISTETYDCNAAPDAGDGRNPKAPPTVQNCRLMRSSFVAYDFDPLRPFNPRFGDHCLDPADAMTSCVASNVRVARGVTRYEDDQIGGVSQNTWTGTDNSDFDGIGNFRHVIESGKTRTGTSSRTRTTDFNPELAATVSKPKPTGPWIGHIHTHSELVEDAQRVRQEKCFRDTDGALLAQRSLVSWTGARAPGDRAVVNSYRADGRLSAIAFYGGEATPIDAALTACALSTATKIPSYKITADYSHGALSAARWINPSSGAHVLKVADRTIDAGTGMPTSARDAAGHQTTIAYDLLGRMTSSAETALGSTTYAYCRATQPGCSQNRVTMVRKSASGRVIGEATYFYDALGRLVEDRAKVPLGPGSSTLASVIVKYDLLGRTVSQTVRGQSAKTESRYSRGLGHVFQTIRPDGAIVRHNVRGPGFRRDTVKVAALANPPAPTDHDAHTTQFTDAFGRLVKVHEASGDYDPLTATAPNSAAQATFYQYDAGGNLITVTMPGGQQRTFFYDALGGLRTANHPELDVAETVLSYDALGSPVRIERGADIVETVYDLAGRATQAWHVAPVGEARTLLAETFYGRGATSTDRSAGNVVVQRRHNQVDMNPAAPGSDVRHVIVEDLLTYAHTAGLLTGRTTSVATLAQPASNGSASSSHRAESRVWTEQRSYDDAGQLTSRTLPTCPDARCSPPARSLGFVYETGMPVRLLTDGVPLAELSLASNGLVTEVRHLSSGLIVAREERTADASGMPRLGGLRLLTNSKIHELGQYFYDDAGHVEEVRYGTESDIYRYDLVGRLRHAALAPIQAGQTSTSTNYTYDRLGNLLQKAEGSTVQSFGRNSTTNRVQHPSVSYDAAGRAISWFGLEMDYDALSLTRFVRSASPSGPVSKSFVYAPGEYRIAEIDHVAGTTRWSLRNEDGTPLRDFLQTGPGTTTTWVKDHVRAGSPGSRLVATFDPQHGVRRHLTDHLGSTRVVTDINGADRLAQKFWPFGELHGRVVSTGEPDHGVMFTGHQRDANCNGGACEQPAAVDDMDYKFARQYSPHVGAFSVPDPVLGSAGSPQSWNRYSYVSNDPVAFVDPSGMLRKVAQGLDDEVKTAMRLMTCAYDTENCLGADGFRIIGRVDTYGDGFAGAIFHNAKTNAFMIVPVGTNAVVDWTEANGPEILGDPGSQYHTMLRYSEQAVNVAKAYTPGGGQPNVTFVGHSLAGGMATAGGVFTGYPVITVNPVRIHPNTWELAIRSDGSKWSPSYDLKAMINHYIVRFEGLDLGYSILNQNVRAPPLIGTRHSLGSPGLFKGPINRHVMEGACAAAGINCSYDRRPPP